VIQFFAPKHGGSAMVAYELTKHLAKLGHDVIVITTDFEFDENFAKSLETVKVIPFPYKLNLGGFLVSPSMNKYLKENIDKFDIIHMHNFRTYQNIITHKYAKKYNIPYVLQAHGSVPRIIEKKYLKKTYDACYGTRLLRDASSVIAVSNAEVDQYLQMNVSIEKVKIIPNSIDVDLFSNLPEKGNFKKKHNINEKHMILFLGRLHEIKGIDFLIKSYAELIKERTNVILVLAGPDDGYLERAKSLVEELTLDEHVKFTGFVNGGEKLAAFVDADVLVYPSIFEIFGLVPLEAIMCGTPVIVTNDCGCGEIIKEVECGYLIHYGDVAGLDEALRFALEHPDINRRKVEAGREYVEEHLAWESVMKQVEEMYEGCVRHV